MNLLIALFSIATVALAVSDENLWTKFKEDHGKFYTTKLEEARRFEIFQSNLKDINDHNELYRQGKSAFFKGINQFADLSKEEFVSTVLGPPRGRQVVNGVIWKADYSVFPPDSIDWRDKGVVTDVWQQKCNDFWAFSTTGMLESQYALNREIQAFVFSKQNLIDCSKSYGNSGCNGGYSYATYQYLKEFGINSESDYPYEGADGTCRFKTDQKLLTVTGAIYLQQKNETDFKLAVGSVGPLAISLDASNIGNYAGGVYQDHTCSTDTLNFAAVVVGYGSENGVDYWIVKNSWGTSWGEKGYIRMERNYNICGIATDSSFVLMDVFE